MPLDSPMISEREHKIPSRSRSMYDEDPGPMDENN